MLIFLGIYHLLILNQEQTSNLDKPIILSEIEAILKSFAIKKYSTRPYSFSTKFYQTFKELIPIFLKWFHKLETEGILPIFFNEATVTKTQQEKKITDLYENGCKFLKYIPPKQIKEHIKKKKIIYHDQVVVIQEIGDGSTNVNQYIKFTI